jgi:hypothetical protein
MWVYDSLMTFTILWGRLVGNTGCPAKSSTKGGHPSGWPCGQNVGGMELYPHYLF